jgi:hypothetical protein
MTVVPFQQIQRLAGAALAERSAMSKEDARLAT